MKTFEGLVAGTIVTNPTDGDMMIGYTTYFSEDDTPAQCLGDGKTVWPAYQFDPRDWEVKSVPYYWLDTSYYHGDYSVRKFALIRGYFDENGEKDRSTEKAVVRGEYDDLDLEDRDEDEDCYDAIDDYIRGKIGCVPDYEVD